MSPRVGCGAVSVSAAGVTGTWAYCIYSQRLLVAPAHPYSHRHCRQSPAAACVHRLLSPSPPAAAFGCRVSRESLGRARVRAGSARAAAQRCEPGASRPLLIKFLLFYFPHFPPVLCAARDLGSSSGELQCANYGVSSEPGIAFPYRGRCHHAVTPGMAGLGSVWLCRWTQCSRPSQGSHKILVGG